MALLCGSEWLGGGPLVDPDVKLPIGSGQGGQARGACEYRGCFIGRLV